METRKSSRLIILDPNNRLLLFKYKDEHNGVFWATVGGELKENESYLDAAKRELYEETGLEEEIRSHLRDREEVYAVARSEPALWLEKYYLVQCSDPDRIFAASWTEEEKSTIQNWHWWSLQEILAKGRQAFKPEWLADLLSEAIVETQNA